MRRWLSILVMLRLSAAAQTVVSITTNTVGWESLIETNGANYHYYFEPGVYQLDDVLYISGTNVHVYGNTSNRSEVGVTSNGHPEVVLIAGVSNRVIQFPNMAYPASNVLSGLTITGGSSELGAVYAGTAAGYLPGHHTVSRCHVVSNTAIGLVRVSVENSTIESCSRSGAYGGAYLVNMTNCVVINCYAGGEGGGVYLNSDTRIDNSLVASNSGTRGGGVYGGAVYNSVVISNYASDRGGAFYNVTSVSNYVAWNTSRMAAIAQYGNYTNCLFEHNSSGAVGSPAMNGTWVNCLFASNATTYANGGGAGQYGNFIGCIFDGNEAPNGKPQALYSAAWVYNCTFLSPSVYPALSGQDSYAVANNIICGTTNTSYGTTNLVANYAVESTNGLFIPEDPPYRIPEDSPCRNAGDDTYAITEFDFYGRDRTQGQVDIGAIEWTPEIDAVGGGADRKKMLLLLLTGGEP